MQLLTNILKRSTGVDVSIYAESFFEKALRKRMAEAKCGSVNEYCHFVAQHGEEVEVFTDSLENNYSEFFRNPLTFAVLERIVLPLIILKKKEAGHKELRIWSAACAGGQEAYSLAILLEELRMCQTNHFDYRIFATDRSEANITEARKGKYSGAVTNNLTVKQSKQWFTKYGETYSVIPELKKHIEFSVFDLFYGPTNYPPSSIFGDFDLVVCANLLFYYKREYRDIILEKTNNSLTTGGFLVTGDSERELLKSNNFREVFPQSAIFRR